MKIKNLDLYTILCTVLPETEAEAELQRVLDCEDDLGFGFTDSINLGAAFQWSNTPQGYRFWDDLYIKIEDKRIQYEN